MINRAELEQMVPAEGRTRRECLIQEMTRLETKGFHCFQCSGVCCTFVANSMQTTPLETVELLLYLAAEHRLDKALAARLQETVRRYRLDQEPPGDGRRSFSRRTYTCPFFGDSPKGCSISRSAKPYGCLGFNPKQTGIREGGDCAGNQTLLQSRDDAFLQEETTVNQRLSKRLGWDWEKKPMPVALLELMALMDPNVLASPPENG